MADAEDDLVPEDTTGYVVNSKKTLSEYVKLDAEDEALARWKASLGLTDESKLLPVAPGDTRKVVIQELAVLVDGREPMVFQLDSAQELEELKSKPIVIKESAVYQLRIKFRVQHEIITGLKYLHSVKRGGIRVDKLEEPLGSYAPNTVDKPFYVTTLPPEEAPSGMLVRGTYNAVSKFVDDDKVTHLQFPWTFEIRKNWA